MYTKLMNNPTPSMFVGPSIILLKHIVGCFLASDWAKILISCQRLGHQVVPQRYRLATIVLDYRYMSVQEGNEHLRHVCRALSHTFRPQCLQVSCLRLGQKSWFPANFQATFGHQVAPKACHYMVVLDWHWTDVYRSPIWRRYFFDRQYHWQ